MLSTFASVVGQAEHHVELPIPPFMYGVFALLIFGMMLVALFAFRQAATKVATKENTVSHEVADHDDTGGHH